MSHESFSTRSSQHVPLAVFNVGSYSVSVANNLTDLHRVDTSVFNNCSDVLRQHYTEPYWGFIICQLRDGNQKYHPFAYSHVMLNGTFFIPTRHYHPDNQLGLHRRSDTFKTRECLVLVVL
jgi:hypothetical protein